MLHYVLGGICIFVGGFATGGVIVWNWIGSLKNDLNSAHDKLDNIYRAIKGVKQ